MTKYERNIFTVKAMLLLLFLLELTIIVALAR